MRFGLSIAMECECHRSRWRFSNSTRVEVLINMFTCGESLRLVFRLRHYHLSALILHYTQQLPSNLNFCMAGTFVNSSDVCRLSVEMIYVMVQSYVERDFYTHNRTREQSTGTCNSANCIVRACKLLITCSIARKLKVRLR